MGFPERSPCLCRYEGCLANWCVSVGVEMAAKQGRSATKRDQAETFSVAIVFRS